MIGSDSEAVALEHLGRELVEQIGRGVGHPSADLADEVMMGLRGQVIDGAAMAEVNVVDDPELLERVERPVDGGAVDVRVVGLHRGREIIRALVRMVGGQHGDHRAPHRRDPDPLLPELRHDHIRIHHRGECTAAPFPRCRCEPPVPTGGLPELQATVRESATSQSRFGVTLGRYSGRNSHRKGAGTVGQARAGESHQLVGVGRCVVTPERDNHKVTLDPESIPSFVEWRDSQPDMELGVLDFLQRVDPDIEIVAGIMALVDPRLVERGECVLLADNSDEDDFENWTRIADGDTRVVERQLNHVHVRDMFSAEPRMDALFEEVAQSIAAMWRLRLAVDFPSRQFVVEVLSRSDDTTGPILRFWQEPRSDEREAAVHCSLMTPALIVSA